MREGEQRQGNERTFCSVILAGVYDVKNLKLKLHPSQESKYNSPWNIAADFTVNMAFMPEDIATMLREYEQDHHTGMDIMDMAKQIYDYTCGYPFLVSRVCMIMDEIIARRTDFGVKALAWTQNGLTEAVKELLVESNTLFDDMLKKLDEYPELRKMLYGILFNGEKIPYNADTHVINIGIMFGFLKNDQKVVAVSNRIFETRLYDMFVTEEILRSRVYKLAVMDN